MRYVAHESRKVQSICINFGGDRIMYVHNVYNECHTPSSLGVRTLQTILIQINEENPTAEHLAISNFNLKSLRWEGNASEAKQRKDSDKRLSGLYDIIESQPLSLLLLRKTIKYMG